MNTTQLDESNPLAGDQPDAPVPDAEAKPARRMLLIAVTIITVGAGWLLNTLKLFPNIDWIWTGGLFVAGLLTLFGAGVNRLTFVIGPFLMSASATSLLRQLSILRLDVEAPVLCIVFGVLLLLAYLLPLRTPEFLKENAGRGHP